MSVLPEHPDLDQARRQAKGIPIYKLIWREHYRSSAG
jgi:hypothetical protein